MTRMTGPDCVVMCNLINTHTHTHTTHTHTHTHTHVWLSGRLHTEGRLNEGPRLQRKHKDENEANKTNNVTPEKDAMASANQTPVGYKFAPLVASQQGRENQREPACFGLSYLSLVLPVTFGHTTACRSPALAFSAAIHFAMKCSVPCSTVLRHSSSSWATVVH